MNVLTLLNKFQRLSIQKTLQRQLTTTQPQYIHLTPIAFAEPLKKKKRLDPAVVRAREERRKKKLEKQIRRLEKNQRQLKPIEENQVPLHILDNLQKRQRNDVNVGLTEEILEKRSILQKKWAQFRREQHLKDAQLIDRITYMQQKALDQLKIENEQLYQEAIQIDFRLIPFNFNGPVETPQINGYEATDGEYLDVSKKWE